MRQNMTNKEEAEWLMQWWKNYGQGILLAVIIGLALGFGWRYWNGERHQKALQASVIYAQTQKALSSNQAAIEAAQAELKKVYPKTIYTQLAALDTANQLVADKKYQQAIKILEPVINFQKIPAVAQLARLKIAQLQMELNKPQQALAMLNTVADKSFAPLINNDKARAYALLNQPLKAKQALQDAITGYKALNIDTSMLKLNAGLTA